MFKQKRLLNSSSMGRLEKDFLIVIPSNNDTPVSFFPMENKFSLFRYLKFLTPIKMFLLTLIT